MNVLGDRTLEEIAFNYPGLGLLSPGPAGLSPSQLTRGELPLLSDFANLPTSFDTEQLTRRQEQECKTPVNEVLQQSFDL